MVGTAEMSRYIDIAKYDALERQHPFYVEALGLIIREIRRHKNGSRPVRRTNVVELCAGTGILTEDIFRGVPGISLDAVEIDPSCFKLLRSRFRRLGGEVGAFCEDAVTFQGNAPYDIAVSSFGHHHIAYERARDFGQNLRRIIKPGGVYIVGDELMRPFKTEHERRVALRAYHGYIIQRAIHKGHEGLAQLELASLMSGIERKGDFKRHPDMLVQEMRNAGFSLERRKKVGPRTPADVGGIYVCVFKRDYFM
jgi:SAM-dependent methyltransferase